MLWQDDEIHCLCLLLNEVVEGPICFSPHGCGLHLRFSLLANTKHLTLIAQGSYLCNFKRGYSGDEGTMEI